MKDNEPFYLVIAEMGPQRWQKSCDSYVKALDTFDIYCEAADEIPGSEVYIVDIDGGRRITQYINRGAEGDE
jgi:hypothetical protein